MKESLKSYRKDDSTKSLASERDGLKEPQSPDSVGLTENKETKQRGCKAPLIFILKGEPQALEPDIMAIDLPPQQVECVAQAVYHEARGESSMGQRAVAHVILNRAKVRKLTPCQVIRQPNQFHFKIRARYSGKDWERARQIAYYPGRDPTGGAMYFHSTGVNPKWRNLKVTTRIGNHIFYK